MARTTLLDIQAKLQLHPQDQSLQAQEKTSYLRYKKASILAEKPLIQKSKATWIRLGDDNTKYFHSVIKKRKLQQSVTQIQDEHGVTQIDPIVIAGVFVKFYRNLLGEVGGSRRHAYTGFLKNGPTLEAVQQLNLIKTFTEREVKEAMFSICINKSPGSDGYGGGFFRDAWAIVGNEVTEAVLEFFQNGKLLKQISAT